jgi:predicted ATPase/class 3 adenylate cyclase
MIASRMGLPTGPGVAFLFTDIEGSTRLEQAIGREAWARVAAEHDRLLCEAVERSGGRVVKTEGDAVFAAFTSPSSAIEAAVAGQRALASSDTLRPDRRPRVRMGVHVGEGRIRERRAKSDPEDYVGIDVNYAARVAAAGNGGQIVLSDATVRLLGTGAIEGLPPAGEEAGVTLVDEGMRALKDFEEPARLYRLVVPGAADDPRPLRTLDLPSNLPEPATTLVGREADIERVAAFVERSRVVTLAGPAGTGKTRLALGAAAAVRGRYPHGTWFVDLAAIRDPLLIEGEIADAIGVRETPELSVEDALRKHVRDRELLLVLDNLEQLLPAAAAILARLVRDAPQLRLLATSRELIRIAGEAGYQVPPLAVAAATALFEDRARLHRPDLELGADDRAAIQAICERLEGLPLAIELAAARARLFSPVAILARLGRSLDLAGAARDTPERQRTLRGAIAWSHELLSEPERRLFRRLAVFEGGWDAEQAGVVADLDGDLGVDLLAGLESLVDKSLIRALSTSGGEPRFGHHLLLRDYGLERLDESGELAVVAARHAAVFLELGEAAEQQLLGADSETWLQRLDREEHNLRAAIRWTLEHGRTAEGLRLAGSLWRWWHQRSRLREGRATLAELLAQPTEGVPLPARIRALAADGGLAYWMGDAAATRDRYEERLRLALAAGDPRLEADARYDLGFTFMVAGDAAGLRENQGRALELYLALGDEEGATRARQALVLPSFLDGDFAAGRDLEEQNLSFFQKTGSRFRIADSSTLVSAIYAELGDLRMAWQRLQEGLRLWVEGDVAVGIIAALDVAALLLLRHGEPELGARVAGAVRELMNARDITVTPTSVLHLPEPWTVAAEKLGGDRAEILMADGGRQPLGDVIAAVLAYEAPSSQRSAESRPT